MNTAAVLLHMLDFLGGMNGGKGILLDFVGQCESLILNPWRLPRRPVELTWPRKDADTVIVCLSVAHPASFTRIILYDIGLFLLQITSLVVSYVNQHSTSTTSPSNPQSLPYPDLLLPNSPLEDTLDEEANLESGLSGLRRRRKPQGGDNDEIWLDDDDDDV